MPEQLQDFTLGLDWQPAKLQAQLSPFGPFIVEAVAQTGSTNTDLLDLVRADPAAARVPRVRVAEFQTAGRGRMGRQWQAGPGASLTFSIGLALSPGNGWGALSLAVGMAVAQSLQPWAVGTPPTAGQGRLMLKWPNDLWWFDQEPVTPSQRAKGRKVAGILIETLPVPADCVGAKPGERWVVVGIGINVLDELLPREGLPGLGPAGTSLWRPQEDAPALWHQVAPAVCRALLDFEHDGFEPIRAAATQREVLVGQPITLSSGPVTQGHCVGLDGDGALLIESSHGLHRVVAGEVQVRPDPNAASGGLV
jgi:BirA family biotin operon repressor/biotin-[acetyl-CoA-carboxylase] ligase